MSDKNKVNGNEYIIWSQPSLCTFFLFLEFILDGRVWVDGPEMEIQIWVMQGPYFC